MTETFDDPKLQDALLRELRARAARGANVRELVDCIHKQLGLPTTAIIPVLAYVCRAFHLRLPIALPIREWLGTGDDAAIDALILPAMEATKPEWVDAEPFATGMDTNGVPAGHTRQSTLK